MRRTNDAMDVRTLERRDLATVAGWFGSLHDVVAWAGPEARFPLEESFLEAMLATRTLDGRTCMTFAVTFDASSDVAEGTFGVAVDEADHRATLARIALAPAQRGKRLGVAMVRYAVDFAFATTNAHRLDLSVFLENEPALAAYRENGFELVAGVHEPCLIAGRTYHLARMLRYAPALGTHSRR